MELARVPHYLSSTWMVVVTKSLGGSTISTTQDIFRFYEVEVALAHWSKKSVMKWNSTEQPKALGMLAQEPADVRD